MPKDERFLPRRITRFNYWTFEIASPKPQHQLTPTVQRLGDFPEVTWIDRPGHTALHRHIQHTFHLLLNAPPDIWAKEVFPVQHVKLADIPNRQVFALEHFVEDDKEWAQDAEAMKVLRQCSPSEQDQIWQLDRKRWKYRSQWTWDTLLETIADDQKSFLKYCERRSDERAVSDAMKQRIYRHYSQQAIKLLGGGTYIPKARRNIYRDLLDGSSLLTPSGRLPSPSIFTVNWDACKSNDERREAKKRTLHWFHHALRNLRAYRNRRAQIPWTPDRAQ